MEFLKILLIKSDSSETKTFTIPQRHGDEVLETWVCSAYGNWEEIQLSLGDVRTRMENTVGYIGYVRKMVSDLETQNLSLVVEFFRKRIKRVLYTSVGTQPLLRT